MDVKAKTVGYVKGLFPRWKLAIGAFVFVTNLAAIISASESAVVEAILFTPVIVVGTILWMVAMTFIWRVTWVILPMRDPLQTRERDPV